MQYFIIIERHQKHQSQPFATELHIFTIYISIYINLQVILLINAEILLLSLLNENLELIFFKYEI
jgi:hypothetical protein